jgi:SAM-dependent methyltransferase
MGDPAACRFDAPTPGDDCSGLVGEVYVTRCAACRAGFTGPPIADVAFLYDDRSSQDFQPGTGGLTRAIKHLAFGMQARRLLAQVGGPPPRIAVDFACGSGLFTRRLGDALGAQARMIGCDFHDTGPAELKDREYRPISRLDDLAGAADLVTAMHVIEHDDDPKTLLHRIASLARPGGTIVIEVPNVDCIWAEVFGRRWDAWYLPYHRTHFSRASLQALVESEGLTIVCRSNISLPTFGRSLAKLFRRKNGLFFVLLGAALHPLQWLGEQLFARPAALRIVARKTLESDPES